MPDEDFYLKLHQRVLKDGIHYIYLVPESIPTLKSLSPTTRYLHLSSQSLFVQRRVTVLFLFKITLTWLQWSKPKE